MVTNQHAPPPHSKRANIAWLVFAVLAAFYLWTEHQAHLLGILPYLVVLACPLLHLFMHHGHTHHQGDASSQRLDDEKGGSK